MLIVNEFCDWIILRRDVFSRSKILKKLAAVSGFFLLLMLFILSGSSDIYAQTDQRQYSLVIESFDAEYILHEDNTMDVTEKITVNFFSPHHGIYRDIPFRLTDEDGGEDWLTPITDIQITDIDGNPYEYETLEENDFKRLKIGDPDITITGSRVYVLQYTVLNPVYFSTDDDKAEIFYWDVIPTEFEMPIYSAAATVKYPDGAKLAKKPICYTGGYGSTTQNCIVQVDESAKIISVNTTEPLGVREGATLKAVFAPGSFIDTYGGLQAKSQKVYKIVASVGVVLSLMLPIFLWFKYGKDEKGKDTVVPQFEPPGGMTPLKAKILLKDRFKAKDIASEIIKLAIQGVWKIVEKEEKGLFGKKKKVYSLLLLKPHAEGLSDSDRTLINAIFPGVGLIDKDEWTAEYGEISDNAQGHIKREVVLTGRHDVLTEEDIQALRKVIDEEIEKEGYFVGKRDKKKAWALGIGFFMLFASIFGYAVTMVLTHSGYMFKYPVAVGILRALPVIGLFLSLGLLSVSFFLVKKSSKGVEMLAKLKGLKMYMQLSEKDRISMMQSADARYLEKDSKGQIELFEKLLPYAMIFGLEKTWAEQFKDIYGDKNPSWYDSQNDTFTSMYLVNSLGRNFVSGVSSSIPKPNAPGGSFGSGGFSSGGGGFSGGGGGGGGGGGW